MAFDIKDFLNTESKKEMADDFVLKKIPAEKLHPTKQLNIDGIVSDDFSVDFDIEAIKTYLVGKGKYTEEELAAMDDTAIAKLDTGSRVMLKANVTILDAMEDVDLHIAI